MLTSELARVALSMKRKQTRIRSPFLHCDLESLAGYAAHFQAHVKKSSFYRNHESFVEPLISISVKTPFTLLEVEQILSWLSKEKAASGSSLKNELLRGVRGPLLMLIFQLFDQCFRAEVIPKAWAYTLMHPVSKKSDQTKIANYRLISLTETLRKVYEQTLLPSVSRAFTLHIA
jgi:hypothetical protein